MLEVAAQGVPLIHGIAQLKGPDDLRGEAAFLQVLPARPALGTCQGGGVEGRRGGVGLIGGGALFGLLGPFRPQILQRHRDAVAPGQFLHRLGKAQAVVVHEKRKDVSAHAAAETVKDALLRGHRK